MSKVCTDISSLLTKSHFAMDFYIFVNIWSKLGKRYQEISSESSQAKLAPPSYHCTITTVYLPCDWGHFSLPGCLCSLYVAVSVSVVEMFSLVNLRTFTSAKHSVVGMGIQILQVDHGKWSYPGLHQLPPLESWISIFYLIVKQQRQQKPKPLLI